MAEKNETGNQVSSQPVKNMNSVYCARDPALNWTGGKSVFLVMKKTKFPRPAVCMLDSGLHVHAPKECQGTSSDGTLCAQQ